MYIPCSRPLVHEAERIARVLRDERIDYLLLASAAPACAGGPEKREAAQEYFAVLRTLGIGPSNFTDLTRLTGASGRRQRRDLPPSFHRVSPSIYALLVHLA